MPTRPWTHDHRATWQSPLGKVARSTGSLQQFFEKVVAFVVHENEGREILDRDHVYRLHAQLGILEHLHRGDALLAQAGGRPADRPQIEPAVLLARVRDRLGAVALGQHDHGGTVGLEEGHIGVHAAGRCGAERTGGASGRRLGRAGVVNDVVSQILGQPLAAVQAFLELGVGDVPSHDNLAGELQPRGHRILGQNGPDPVHGLVEVDGHGIRFVTRRLGKITGRVGFQLLQENALGRNLGLDVTIGAATDADADGTGSAVARQAHDPDIMTEVFPAELGPDAQLLGPHQQGFFHFQITETMAALATRDGQAVQVAGRGELDGLEVELRRGSAHHHGEVVGRAGRRTQGFHLGGQKIHERARIEDRLGFLIQVGLVGRAAALGDKKKFVGIARRGIDLHLGRQVASGVLLVVHGERRILGIAQVALGVGVEHASGEGLLVAAAGPDLLPFLAHDDRRAGILAHGEFHLGGNHRILQHFQGHVTVVGRTLRVFEDLLQLGQVPGPQQMRDIPECRFGQQRQPLGRHFEHSPALKCGGRDMLGGQLPIGGIVVAEGQQICVLEFDHDLFSFSGWGAFIADE
ncbi:conserved hypothetical protein [Desulfosarcina cetonica]|nr:conserved hypothetical protein [Desulfosarcina cetonica]